MFEAHITYAPNPCFVPDFKSLASNLLVKAQIWSMQGLPPQWMFGVREETFSRLDDRIFHIIKTVFEIHRKMPVRLKIETDIEQAIPDGTSTLYYESHITAWGAVHQQPVLQAARPSEYGGLGVSKNMLEPEERFCITARALTWGDCEAMTTRMESHIHNNNLPHKKTEIERCIFDSNIDLDAGWLVDIQK